MAEDRLLYVGQKAFVNKNGEILVLNDPEFGLDFPGGKLQEGETDFTEALQREVREETSLEIDVGDPFFTWYFEFPKKSSHRNAGKMVFLVGCKCKYISGEVKLSQEHNSFQWINKSNFQELKENSDYFRALEKYFASP